MFAKALIGLGMSLALLGTSAAGQESALDLTQEDAVYPATEWAQAPFPAEVAPVVQSLIDDAMSRELDDVMGESREIVVIHKGRLVAEAYREGYSADTKLVSWSMAKSITQALVGRAVHERLIADIDQPMLGLWEVEDPHASISWRQWMTMTDGLEYAEVGETDLAKNDVVQMMFGSGRFDVVDYALSLSQIHEAGTHWNYSTAAYHLISKALFEKWEDYLKQSGELDYVPPTPGDLQIVEVVQSGPGCSAAMSAHLPVLKQSNIADETTAAYLLTAKKCLRTNLMNLFFFTPLGMDAQPEFDASGTFLGGSLVYASARDFARFGYLYLRDGVWGGERLLPEGWVDFATTAHEGTDTNVYGAGWWITPPEGETPTHSQSAKSAPYDAFHAGGNEGQTIWVVPSKDLVIVRLGLMSNAPENWAALYEWNQEVARAFPDVAQP
ncbi:MAG: serine hydrolase [Hyphomonadaceae bacterium]